MLFFKKNSYSKIAPQILSIKKFQAKMNGFLIGKTDENFVHKIHVCKIDQQR
jgi:hypothetical protein